MCLTNHDSLQQMSPLVQVPSIYCRITLYIGTIFEQLPTSSETANIIPLVGANPTSVGGGDSSTTLARARAAMDHGPWTNLQVRNHPGGLRVDGHKWDPRADIMASPYFEGAKSISGLGFPGSMVFGGIRVENLKTPSPGQLEIC